MPPIRTLRERETRTRFDRSGVEIYPTINSCFFFLFKNEQERNIGPILYYTMWAQCSRTINFIILNEISSTKEGAKSKELLFNVLLYANHNKWRAQTIFLHLKKIYFQHRRRHSDVLEMWIKYISHFHYTACMILHIRELIFKMVVRVINNSSYPWCISESRIRGILRHPKCNKLLRPRNWLKLGYLGCHPISALVLEFSILFPSGPSVPAACKHRCRPC
jgi:hypothetical protein